MGQAKEVDFAHAMSRLLIKILNRRCAEIGK